MSLPRTFSSAKPITLWETLVKLEWHNDTSGIHRVLFGNPSLFIRFVFFDTMTLSCLLRCDIMLLFGAIYFLCNPFDRCQHKVDGKWAFFCTRRKIILYAYKIIFLRDAGKFSLRTYKYRLCHNAVFWRTSTFFLLLVMSRENYEGLTNPYRRIVGGIWSVILFLFVLFRYHSNISKSVMNGTEFLLNILGKDVKDVSLSDKET